MNLLLNQTPDILALRETNLDDSIDSIDSLSVLLLFPLSITFFLFVHGFDSISSDINEVLSINPSNVLSLETLTPLIRTDLSILVELIGLVNSIIIFLSQMTLLIWLTFLLRSQAVIIIVLLFWIYLFLLKLIFILQCLSFHWEILIM